MLFNKLIELVIYPFQLFEELLNSTSTINLFIGAFGIYATYRFILSPLLGGRTIAGSDSVKSKNNSKNRNSSKSSNKSSKGSD